MAKGKTAGKKKKTGDLEMAEYREADVSTHHQIQGRFLCWNGAVPLEMFRTSVSHLVRCFACMSSCHLIADRRLSNWRRQQLMG
jgi:hypothetical protein